MTTVNTFDRESRVAEAIAVRQFDIDGRAVNIYTFANDDGVVSPKWQYFSEEELQQHAGKFALVEKSYVQFACLYACKIEDWVDVATGWNEAVEIMPDLPAPSV